jgi:hypothetical protein
MKIRGFETAIRSFKTTIVSFKTTIPSFKTSISGFNKTIRSFKTTIQCFKTMPNWLVTERAKSPQLLFCRRSGSVCHQCPHSRRAAWRGRSPPAGPRDLGETHRISILWSSDAGTDTVLIIDAMNRVSPREVPPTVGCGCRTSTIPIDYGSRRLKSDREEYRIWRSMACR